MHLLPRQHHTDSSTVEPRLLTQGITLEYITLGWNIIGSLVIMASALTTHSIALAGFGLDSLIEIGASTIVVWELTGQGKGREKPALRFIGYAFLALALYILVQSLYSLAFINHPTISIFGIVWLVLTFLLMSYLAHAKTRIGERLDNIVLKTEGKVTLVDAYLAAAVLLSLLLNFYFGFWWADPLAGLVIVFYALKEGRHALKEAVGH